MGVRDVRVRYMDLVPTYRGGWGYAQIAGRAEAPGVPPSPGPLTVGGTYCTHLPLAGRDSCLEGDPILKHTCTSVPQGEGEIKYQNGTFLFLRRFLNKGRLQGTQWWKLWEKYTKVVYVVSCH